MADEVNTDEQFRAAYNTKLSPADEAAYSEWVKSQGAKAGRDMNNDEIDYDMRGAWKSGAAQADNGHFPDTYKKPNHPTFSEESQYHGAKDEKGEEQKGGRWHLDKNGEPVAFQQSQTNAKHWPEWAIKDYLNRVEPGVKLRKDK